MNRLLQVFGECWACPQSHTSISSLMREMRAKCDSLMSMLFSGTFNWKVMLTPEK